MEYKDMNNPIDVEFEEDTSTRYINGKPIYWNTSQVAEQLGIESSAVRYYCDCFSDFIKVKRSGRNRKFTDKNIEQLKFIKKLLKEDNLTIEQAKEFLSLKDTSKLEHKIENEEPLPAKILATMVSKQLSEQLENIKVQIIEEIIGTINTNFEYQSEIQQQTKVELKDCIAVTVDEIVTETLDNSLKEFKATLDIKEQEANKRDIEMLDLLHKNLEARRQEDLQKQNKGFFSRLFRK